MAETRRYIDPATKPWLEALNKNALEQIRDLFVSLESDIIHRQAWGDDIRKKRHDLNLCRDTINCLDAAIEHAG